MCGSSTSWCLVDRVSPSVRRGDHHHHPVHPVDVGPCRDCVAGCQFRVSQVRRDLHSGQVVRRDRFRPRAGRGYGDQVDSWINPTLLVCGCLAVTTYVLQAGVFLTADAARVGSTSSCTPHPAGPTTRQGRWGEAYFDALRELFELDPQATATITTPLPSTSRITPFGPTGHGPVSGRRGR